MSTTRIPWRVDRKFGSYSTPIILFIAFEGVKVLTQIVLRIPNWSLYQFGIL